MISKGRDMSAFFPQVVKQVASPSVEIRKLVSLFPNEHVLDYEKR
jgi:AP-3 complex subunit beta